MKRPEEGGKGGRTRQLSLGACASWLEFYVFFLAGAARDGEDSPGVPVVGMCRGWEKRCASTRELSAERALGLRCNPSREACQRTKNRLHKKLIDSGLAGKELRAYVACGKNPYRHGCFHKLFLPLIITIILLGLHRLPSSLSQRTPQQFVGEQ